MDFTVRECDKIWFLLGFMHRRGVLKCRRSSKKCVSSVFLII